MKVGLVKIGIDSLDAVKKGVFYKLGIDVTLDVQCKNDLSDIKNSLKFVFDNTDAVLVIYSENSWHKLQKAMLMEFERSSIFVNGEEPYVIAKGFNKVAHNIFADKIYGKPVAFISEDLKEDVDIKVLKGYILGRTVRIGVFKADIDSEYKVYSNEFETILSVPYVKVGDVLKNIDDKDIYTTNGLSPAESVFDLLVKKHLKISVAESCTGGLIAAAITDIPGSSECFIGGFITYSNFLKEKTLGVYGSDLNELGAVSESVARQMAYGALVESDSDYAVAVTGIAGPAGGSEAKPVGLVYIAAASKDNLIVKKMNFSGNRRVVREKTARFAMLFLRKYIIENR